MIILCLIVTIYYNVIMAYSIVYLGASIVGTYEELPWTYCGKNEQTLMPNDSEFVDCFNIYFLGGYKLIGTYLH
jgi:hypothetical protein